METQGSASSRFDSVKFVQKRGLQHHKGEDNSRSDESTVKYVREDLCDEQGTDWHSNLQIDHQNMVTKGDLPRFVMDSYEECRGPSRLFLLDNFKCSEGKENSQDKVIKKKKNYYSSFSANFLLILGFIRKRGSRWRNEEIPEVLPRSHAKLHQLLEERIENGINVPLYRVKLKRKLNEFPFDLKTGKSYMKKFLEASSPEQKVMHEVGIGSSPLRLPSTDAYETSVDIEDIRPPSPCKEVMQRNKKASLSSSPPQLEENSSLRPCLDEINGKSPTINCNYYWDCVGFLDNSDAITWSNWLEDSCRSYEKTHRSASQVIFLRQNHFKYLL